MAINYLVEINQLDDWEMTHPLSQTAYKLMRKLQYLANKERFPAQMRVSNGLLRSMVGCSEDSLSSARNQLVQAGLITYQGRKRLTPLYGIRYFSQYKSPLSADFPRDETPQTYRNKEKEKQTKPNSPCGGQGEEKTFASLSPALQKACSLWCGYKAERGRPMGAIEKQTLLSVLTAYLKQKPEEKAIAAIENSIACGYVGIVWENAKTADKPKAKEQSYQNQRIYTDDYNEPTPEMIQEALRM